MVFDTYRDVDSSISPKEIEECIDEVKEALFNDYSVDGHLARVVLEHWKIELLEKVLKWKYKVRLHLSFDIQVEKEY